MPFFFSFHFSFLLRRRRRPPFSLPSSGFDSNRAKKAAAREEGGSFIGHSIPVQNFSLSLSSPLLWRRRLRTTRKERGENFRKLKCKRKERTEFVAGIPISDFFFSALPLNRGERVSFGYKLQLLKGLLLASVLVILVFQMGRANRGGKGLNSAVVV